MPDSQQILRLMLCYTRPALFVGCRFVRIKQLARKWQRRLASRTDMMGHPLRAVRTACPLQLGMVS